MNEVHIGSPRSEMIRFSTIIAYTHHDASHRSGSLSFRYGY
ncbi:hypothetical protein [Syntrophomonas zehnderi]|nr:hypothetical protein [Syntrophomonas zehnderi]